MNWVVLSMLASLCWGVQYATYGAKLRGTPVGPYLFFYMASLACGLFVWNLREGRIPRLTAAEWGPTLVCILCGAVGTYLTLLGIQKKDAPLVAMVEVSYPFFALVISVLVFRQGEFNMRAVLGGLLIAAGIFLVTKPATLPTP